MIDGADSFNSFAQWLSVTAGYDGTGSMTRDLVLFLLAYWEVLQGVLIVTAIVIFVSSAEDLLLDLMYWLFVVFGRRSQPRFDRLVAKPERLAAMLVPAWQEHEVIARMLSNTVGTSRYRSFHIFVGVYANDQRTRDEVDYVCRVAENVHRVDVGHDGPTNKADCLNAIVRGALEYERRHGLRFEFFVNHDAEDVVHPHALHVMNHFIEDQGLVQLPVRSLDRGMWRIIAGHYMDEFAEWHGKDLIIRSALTRMSPSAGVGTAISRDAMEALLEEGGDDAFNTSSLTEDYDVAHRLRQLGFPSRFVRYTAPHPDEENGQSRRRSEVVDTREFFPHRMRAAIRQKARWMLGISYFGWRQLGWSGDLANRYFLMRDRKALITAPAAIIGYLLVLHWLVNIGVVVAFPELDLLPPLVEQDWVWTLIYANFALMVNRLFHRALFVGRSHGLGQVWLSPLRAVVGNYIAFRAFTRATRLYLWNALTGRDIAWDKTRHRFPAASRLSGDKRSLADIITYWGMVTPQELRRALVQQRKTGRPLGLQLLDLGAIDDDSLAQAFGELFGTQSGTFDPLEIPASVRDLLRPKAAARLTAFVVDRPDPKQAIVAIAEPLTERQQRSLIRLLAARGVRDVGFRFAPLSDIAFAIRFGFDDTTLSNEKQAVANLRMQGRITKDQEKLLWRAVRKEYARVGDILARQRPLKHRAIVKAVNQNNRRRLGTRLRKMGVVTGRQLTTALNSQLSLPIDVFGIGRRTGIISPDTSGQALGRRARSDAGELGAVAAE